MKYQMPTKAEINAYEYKRTVKEISAMLFHAVVVAALVGGPMLYYIANIK